MYKCNVCVSSVSVVLSTQHNLLHKLNREHGLHHTIINTQLCHALDKPYVSYVLKYAMYGCSRDTIQQALHLIHLWLYTFHFAVAKITKTTVLCYEYTTTTYIIPCTQTVQCTD